MKSPDCHDPNPDVIPDADVDALALIPRDIATGTDDAAGDATVEAALSSPFGAGDTAATAGADERASAGGTGESPTEPTESVVPARVVAEPIPRRAVEGVDDEPDCPERDPRAGVDRPDEVPTESEPDTAEPGSAWPNDAPGPAANQAPTPSAPIPSHAYGRNRPRVRCWLPDADPADVRDWADSLELPTELIRGHLTATYRHHLRGRVPTQMTTIVRGQDIVCHIYNENYVNGRQSDENYAARIFPSERYEIWDIFYCLLLIIYAGAT